MSRTLILVIALCCFTGQAFAQQQTPSQLALQMNGIIGGWAQQLEAQQQRITELQSQLAVVTKERDELKAKASQVDQGQSK